MFTFEYGLCPVIEPGLSNALPGGAVEKRFCAAALLALMVAGSCLVYRKPACCAKRTKM